MKAFSITHYAGILRGTLCTWDGRGGVIELASIQFPDELPERLRVVGWDGGISAFRRLHVGSWLSSGPSWSGGPGVFGRMETGDRGGANGSNSGINLEVEDLHLNYWAHNMRVLSADFHIGYTIYYEEP